MSFKLSIILPVLNNAVGFRLALNSILVQGNKAEIELIVVDGGSVDGTLEVIDSYRKDITYFESGHDSGIASAFNRGISRCTGDIVGILNSDDVLEVGALERLAEVAERSPSADVYFGAIRYYDPVRDFTYVRNPDLSQMHWRMSIFHPAIFVRRSCYERVGLYDCEYTHAMDSEWCHRAMSVGMTFCEIPSVMATMTLGGLSDREYKKSLQQYRNSLIKYGITKPVAAYSYYYFYFAVKSIMRLPVMQPIKQFRDRLLASSE